MSWFRVTDVGHSWLYKRLNYCLAIRPPYALHLPVTECKKNKSRFAHHVVRIPSLWQRNPLWMPWEIKDWLPLLANHMRVCRGPLGRGCDSSTPSNGLGDGEAEISLRWCQKCYRCRSIIIWQENWLCGSYAKDELWNIGTYLVPGECQSETAIE